MIDVSRRSFLAGLGAVLVTAPAIVRAASIMPVKMMPVQGIVQELCYAGEGEFRYYSGYEVLNLKPCDLEIARLLENRLEFATQRMAAIWARHLDEVVYRTGTCSAPGGLSELVA